MFQVLKNALNGDQNVTNAKNAAKNALNNLTSINNAQKRDLTTKIDQATVAVLKSCIKYLIHN